ncbi:calcium permeable stress-gated cation channel 1-like isoform X1 [Mytilus trossulus]|uniref:calcium permeable stress-gated cation channel 1-like isoform X1 n=1 Tax=Mytilus trossulus TaxID=6551 RepID=UPI0030053C14
MSNDSFELPCDVLTGTNHSTPYGRLNDFWDLYNGVPFNLTVNVAGFLILLLLFALLRKIAWDYGRIALVSRTEEKPEEKKSKSDYNVWTSLFYGDHDEKPKIGSQESLDTHIHLHDNHFFAWITAYFKVKDSDIAQKNGRDAMQYLTFQRYLIIYTAMITVLSVVVILPINFQGDNIGSDKDLGHTTIGNLDPDSKYLWVHAILAVVYLIILVALMRHFSLNLDFTKDEQVSKTLMVSHIPRDKCYKNTIQQHFQEAYPEVVVLDIQFAYNISKLVKLDKKRKMMAEAKFMSELEYDGTGTRPTLRPYLCGRCLCDCCGCEKVDAIDYYKYEEDVLIAESESQKVTAYRDPAGIAFVTFEIDYMAEKVLTDFKAACKGTHNPLQSSLFTELAVEDWRVKYAPSPENIYWENLSKSTLVWWIQAIIINMFLIILLFFFTTPLIVINNLNEININVSAATEKISPFVEQFVPTILLWTFAALLPNIVYWSDQLVGHWTRTAEHHNIMVKCYVFLLLMVLILPSLGLTSAKALFQWFVMDLQKNFRWKCIFLSGNGAFFINYIITATFIGTALELLRFSELFMYAFHLCMTRSNAEKVAVRKSMIWEFQFGIQYAWMLCVFCVIVVYSIPCPLIAPFGLLYMIFKHAVDRYNIYFAYKRSRINKYIHQTAINFVVVAVIMLQCNIVFFTIVRSEGTNAVFVFSAVCLFLSLIIFIGKAFFGWFKHLDTNRYKSAGLDDEQFGESDGLTTPPETNEKPFIASVLLNRNSTDESVQVSTSSEPVGVQGKTNYGSVNEKHTQDPYEP